MKLLVEKLPVLHKSSFFYSVKLLEENRISLLEILAERKEITISRSLTNHPSD